MKKGLPILSEALQRREPSSARETCHGLDRVGPVRGSRGASLEVQPFCLPRLNQEKPWSLAGLRSTG